MTASPAKWTEVTVPIPPVFQRIDDAVDRWFEDRLRPSRTADAVMYTASAVGDHGIIWLVLAGFQAAHQARNGEVWKRAFLRSAIGLGVESIVVNGPVKFIFRRSRPVYQGPRPRYLRTPRTSSFPSGHAAAAFFGAALLRDSDDLWPLYYALAVTVAASRVHVKIHHASDVIGGGLLGIALGELARKMVPITDEAESPGPGRG